MDHMCNLTAISYIYVIIILSFLQSDLGRLSGSIQYPVPNKKAVASRIGNGRNAIVFVVFHAGKEFAVKKVRNTLIVTL